MTTSPAKAVTHPTLRAEGLPRPATEHPAFDGALQVLATWSIRAAQRAQNEGAYDPASLDSSGSQSDESPCLRERSGSPFTQGGNA